MVSTTDNMSNRLPHQCPDEEVNIRLLNVNKYPSIRLKGIQPRLKLYLLELKSENFASNMLE